MSDNQFEEKSICVKCGKEIVISIETGGDYERLTGTTRNDETHWCLECDNADYKQRQTAELRKNLNKYLKIAKKVYLCPVDRCTCKLETKEALAEHILTEHNDYYGNRDLAWLTSQ